MCQLCSSHKMNILYLVNMCMAFNESYCNRQTPLGTNILPVLFTSGK